MHAVDGLMLEGVPLGTVAHDAGTPCWVYSAGTIRARYRAFAGALATAGIDAHVHYAVKANDHLAVLHLLGSLGAGADVVSAGELLRARHAGIAAERIVFSGVGKTAHELRLALEMDMAQINVESAEELAMLSAIAAGMGRTACVALRVNPDIDARTHAKITTGVAGNKFGIAHDEIVPLYRRAAALPGIAPVGLAVHIGSQVTTMAPYRAAYGRIAALVRGLREEHLPVSRVDCGGGLGIAYRDAPAALPEALAGAIAATLGDLDLALIVEPGRWLVGPAGLLLASVILVRRSEPRLIVLDAAMNDLIRPAMYDAWHGIVPVSPVDATQPATPADVVGPVCETADTFARSRALPPLAPDAIVAILDAGAYGAVMSSTYNARPLAAQVLVDGDRHSLIRARQTHAALWQGEQVPDFLTER